MNTQILIDAIKSNLFPAGNAELIEVAMAALGHAGLGHQMASDMIRFAETTKAANAEIDIVDAWMSGVHAQTALGAECERRQKEFWETVGSVKIALGIEQEA